MFKPEVDAEKCIGCESCIEVCEQEAIMVEEIEVPFRQGINF